MSHPRRAISLDDTAESLSATINERLDYFVGSVRYPLEVLRAARPGERLFDRALLDDVTVRVPLGPQAKEGTLRRIETAGAYVLVVSGR